MIHRGQIDGIKLYLLPRLVKLKPRKKKNSYSNHPKKNKKVLGNSIEKRPEHINSQKRYYEIDAVKGKNGKNKTCIITLVDRKADMPISCFCLN